MLEKELLSVSNADKLVIYSAGGDAGLSAIAHLQGYIPSNKIEVYDFDQKVQSNFSRMGIKRHSYKKGIAYLAMPTQDRSTDHMQRMYGHTEPYQYIKNISHNFLERYAHKFSYATVPKFMIGPLVVRDSISSGMKGTTIINNEVIATPYIRNGIEFVVDYNRTAGMYLPRITHQLKGGRDSFVTLMSNKHILYNRVVQATEEIAQVLKCQFGNMQLILDQEADELMFIEHAPRLSGSSWINLQTGNNILMGVSCPIEKDITVHTSGAMYL